MRKLISNLIDKEIKKKKTFYIVDQNITVSRDLRFSDVVIKYSRFKHIGGTIILNNSKGIIKYNTFK